MDTQQSGVDCVFPFVVFPGQYYDSETALHYNYFRDYDPSTGRYIQSDPIGLDGGLNTYAYVGARPTILVDADGREPKGITWASLAEMACKALVSKYMAERQAYIDSAQQHYNEKVWWAKKHRDDAIEDCLRAYHGWDVPAYGAYGPGHKDDCKFDNCYEAAMATYKDRTKEANEELRTALKNNPWKRPPVCAPSKKPADPSRRR